MNSLNTRIKLRDGNMIPVLGLGCSRMASDEVAYQSVTAALKEGYRLFDTAPSYGTEKPVGRALRDSGMRREEYFVVAKVDCSSHGYEEAKQSLANSLENLGLEYVDLFLIHTPRPGRVMETWRALMDLKKEGKTRSIGVSNFNAEHLTGFMKHGMEKPVVNETEIFPLHQQADTVAFCHANNIVVLGYSPLGLNQYFKDGEIPIVDAIASKLNKTKAQVFLRWSVQSKIIPIPKSSNSGRLRENADVFNWSISEEDMKTISTIDRNIEVSLACSVLHKSWEFLENVDEKGVWRY